MCYDDNSFVTMSNDRLKQVSYIVKGDIVMSLNNTRAKVVCVIKTEIRNKIELCNINGGLFTKWSPVFVNNKWYYADDVCQSKLTYVENLYDFVLDKHHLVYINDIAVVTLGHEFTDNDVVSHPYFGSKKIIEDLELIPGYQEGLILNLKTIQRCGSYNLVSKVGI